MRTPVDSIEIPAEYVELCEQWHGGKRSMFYAVASTGGLARGEWRPEGCRDSEQWYLTLWRNLASEASVTRKQSSDSDDADDYEALCQFERWCDKIVDRLTKEYDLENWED